ncbi:MAG: tetratricopeptide repeat protein [Pseudomonadota bacterium]|mgnify:CR=1 FL=1
MRRIPFLQTPALALLLVSVSSWAAEAAVPASQRFDSPAAAAQFHILAGELAAQRNQPLEAAAQLLKALDYTDDVELAQRASLLAFAGNDPALTLKASTRWLQLDPNNLEPREILLRSALSLNRTSEAEEQAKAIVEGHAGGEDEGLRHVALLLSQDRAAENAAMQLMQTLQKLWPERPAALYAQGILAMRFARYEQAEASARAALKLDDASEDARLLLLGAQVKRGLLEDADETADQLIAVGQDETELRLGYVKLLVDAQHGDAARKQLERIRVLQPDNEEAQYALALLAMEGRNLDEAAALLEPLAASDTLGNDVAFYLGGIAQLQRRYADALVWYEKVSSGGKALDALLRRASMLARLEQVVEARSIFENLREQAPMLGSRIDSEEAGMLLEIGQATEALAVLDRALKLSVSDLELLYARSLVYERLKRIERAENDLRRMLKANADDARALNALGFMLTVHTQRFDEAKKLLTRALELTPDDAAVIDSYGWVQFRTGKTQDAKVTLEKAYGKLKDSEIAAHLGEVLWTLGEKDRAREIWDAALAEDPEHRVLTETIKRLDK